MKKENNPVSQEKFKTLIGGQALIEGIMRQEMCIRDRYMNAGAYGGELKQVVESVTILTMDGAEDVYKRQSFRSRWAPAM